MTALIWFYLHCLLRRHRFSFKLFYRFMRIYGEPVIAQR